MRIASLDVQSPTSPLRAGLVMELHPRRGIVKAGAFPFQGVVCLRRGGSDEGGEEIDGAVEGVQYWPRRLSWK